MKTNKRLTKRLISGFLSFAMLLTILPLTAFAASGAADSLYHRIADDNTMDLWKEYFPVTGSASNPLSTQNAGGVWTDKSVFTNADAFPAGVTMMDEGKNFLTALSAIAANKEVVGYSTVPTDTVFVLDLSNSMSQSNVDDLVDATNAAIQQLQAINKNNRVGVVLYSGSSDDRTYDNSVAALMPIDRYTTTNPNGKYIEYTNNGTVRLARSWTNALQVSGTKGTIQSESKSHGGATYIQAGLWEAYNLFNAVPDDEIVIGNNNWQAGESRMPILVLMSDGAPTLGTTYFDNVSNSYYGNRYSNATKSNVGNGNDSNITAGQGFLVQLTASYIRNRIENKYKVAEENGAGRSLFYTLGFNISADNDNNIEAGDIAFNVLNPDATTITDQLWSTYQGLTATRNTMEVSVKGRNGDRTNVTITRNSYATSKSYVDKYFSATGNGLSDAFNDIVVEIILQSRYYPTHLEGGNPDFSGYITFTDELGEYMEVKRVNGILLGNTLFDGHMMASKLNTNTEDGLGTPSNPTSLGNEFIWAVQSRLGISNVADARLLVSEAYKAGQIRYVTDGAGNPVEWSNYIGWYADAAGNYIGHWNEDPQQALPEKAVYQVKSYGFLGETSGSIKNSDMMYMSVQVKTDITTGKQTVTWKIPASLVPMVTYLIALDGTSVDTSTGVNITVEDVNVSPIRLVFETGLRSDLNEYNITQIQDPAHIATDGSTRIFWNNHFANLSAPSHNDHITTRSEFTPNKENERFYYTFDSAVYKLVGNDYELVTQSEGLDPQNGTYYHRRYIFSATSQSPIFFYEQMSPASVQAAYDNGFNPSFEDLTHQTVGAWVVPKGTPARELDMYNRQKASNPTNSSNMVFHPFMTDQNNLVHVDMNLGNNGLLSVTPATGIKVTKTVDIYEDGTSDTFKFRITASQSGTFTGWITAANATPTGDGTPVTLTDGVYEFELKKDQTFWLIGLDAGTAYVVEEISGNSDYKIKSVHVNGAAADRAAAGIVSQNFVDDVAFVNTAIGEGDLVITKQVVDQNGNPVDVNDAIKFPIQVALTNASGDPVSGTFEATGGTVTVPASGILTLQLSDGESFILRGIPEKTNYTVSETATAGFTLNQAASTLTGTVDIIDNDQALVVNTYTPTGTDGRDVSVEVTKTISGNRNTWQDGESYTFTLFRVNTARATSTVVATDTISHSDAEKRISFSLDKEDYDAAGTYYYTISETVGTQGGITYDTAIRSFSVVVADTDMNGDLQIVSVNNEANTVVSGQWVVTANYNNIYAPTASDSVAINIQKQINGNHSLAGFQFALYSDSALENELLRSNITGADGKAVLNLTYAPNRATMEGTVYTYYLAEIQGDNPNITYSSTVYKVNVTVKDNGDGTISASAAVEGVNGNTVTFTNTYTPDQSAFATISGIKVISTNNRVLNTGEFGFRIEAHSNTPGAPLPAETVVRNAADGSFIFPAIEYTSAGVYQYIVSEVADHPIGGFTYDQTKYLVTVTVEKDTSHTPPVLVSTVKLDVIGGASDVADIRFENAYSATPTTVTFRGTKHLTGKAMQNDEFSFALQALTAGAPMPSGNTTVKNRANGTFEFGTITFTEAGTYRYTITEVAGSDDRYDYDTSVYTLTVTVTDNSEGKLSSSYTISKNGMASGEIVFVNSFVPTPKEYDIHAVYGGDKVLTGRSMEAGEFTFTLFNAINGLQIGASVQNDASGKFRFPAVTLPEAGTYHFKILESVGDKNGVSYDTSSYHILVVVEQDVDGNLSIVREELHKGTTAKENVGGTLTEVTKYENITANGQIVFNNTYKADATQVTLEATKFLSGRDLVDGEFKFDLHKTDSTFAYNDSTLLQDDVALTLNPNGTGNVKFASILFEQAGTYHFAIVEDEVSEKGVTPDTTVYEVTVTVTDDQNGNLVASVKVNGADVA
ncbi:MAG: VWA domain-containing protein, partial [Oscillospiraceae bacterium]|nr:VWA domain-containing protein [Oscillospiraceae bacterium]